MLFNGMIISIFAIYNESMFCFSRRNQSEFELFIY